MYLVPDRPEIPRQRSNSLPIGLATLNAEEAGILFSAAEKATARRRRPVSVATPSWRVDFPTDEDSNWPLPSNSTIKPSPLKNITSQDSDAKKITPKASQVATSSRAFRHLETNRATNGSTTTLAYADSPLKALPLDPTSPTKRQVTTHSLKSYADGLFQFTQNRLVTAVPQVQQQHLTSPVTGIFRDEPAPTQKDAAHKSQPSLESRFSDWSITTRDSESIRESIILNTPVLDMDAVMMSPDSFFSGFDEHVSRKDVNRLQRTTGYASSETYEPTSEFPFRIPPPPRKTPKPAEEFSYFANFDLFLNQNSSSQDSQHALEPPESLAIKISPMEHSLSPPTPPPPRRARAETALRQPVIARSCSSGPIARFARSSPATPYHMADVGIRVPNWCVGAMG